MFANTRAGIAHTSTGRAGTGQGQVWDRFGTGLGQACERRRCFFCFWRVDSGYNADLLRGVSEPQAVKVGSPAPVSV